MTGSNLVFALELTTDWYRQPSVKVAFVLSLLVHAVGIAFLPGLRVPKPVEPAPIVVELVPRPLAAAPAPLVAPERLPVVQPPPAIQKKQPEPPPPPPIIRPDLKPEPQLAPLPEIRVAPPEPRPEPKPQVLPEPRVEAPPPAAVQPRIEPQAEARVEPPPAPRVQAPAPAVPQSPPALDPSVLKTYGGVLAEAIGKRKNYPRIARLRNWQGTAELRLVLSFDGKLKDVTVARTSGFEVLDQQAISMVKESLPLPDVPESLRGREFAINVPVAFKLQ